MSDVLKEVAYWTGQSLEDLRTWQTVELLPDLESAPLTQLIERVRLIRFAVDRGYSPQRIAEIASRHGDIIGEFAEQLASMVGEPVCSADEAVERSELSSEFAGPLLAAAGLADE